MAVIRIVNVGDEHVAHVVHVSVKGSVGRQDTGLHHVAQDVDALVFCQGYVVSFFLNKTFD